MSPFPFAMNASDVHDGRPSASPAIGTYFLPVTEVPTASMAYR